MSVIFRFIYVPSLISSEEKISFLTSTGFLIFPGKGKSFNTEIKHDVKSNSKRQK